MTITIDTPNYAYIPGGVITVGATLTISEGSAIVAQTGISASMNIREPDWVNSLKASLVVQAREYIQTYSGLAHYVLPLFPGATTFEEAAQQLITDVAAEVVNG